MTGATIYQQLTDLRHDVGRLTEVLARLIAWSVAQPLTEADATRLLEALDAAGPARDRAPQGPVQ